MKDELFDVIAVNLITHEVEVMSTRKTAKNAEAIEMMAVIRRGVEECFYTTVPTGKFSDGDTYK